MSQVEKSTMKVVVVKWWTPNYILTVEYMYSWSYYARAIKSFFIHTWKPSMDQTVAFYLKYYMLNHLGASPDMPIPLINSNRLSLTI